MGYLIGTSGYFADRNRLCGQIQCRRCAVHPRRHDLRYRSSVAPRAYLLLNRSILFVWLACLRCVAFANWSLFCTFSPLLAIFPAFLFRFIASGGVLIKCPATTPSTPNCGRNVPQCRPDVHQSVRVKIETTQKNSSQMLHSLINYDSFTSHNTVSLAS